MKIRRNALFCLSAFLLSLLLITNPLGVGKLSVDQVQAQSVPRPYVILVNGNADCCIWAETNSLYMNELWNIPNAEFRMTAWDHFQHGGKQRQNIDIGFLGSYSTSNDRDFINQASDFINNQLDQNRPLIIIGHSYGGDSVLKLAHRVNRRIQFLGVIDPVGAGGFRTPIRNHGVPSNVDYFFNRWQENAFATDNIVPFDSRGSGSINGCNARTCDQQEQSLARNEDSSEIRVSCESWEVTCDGYNPIPVILGGSNGTKAKRLTHNPMPSDAYIQRQILDRISEVLASFTPSVSSNSGVIYAVNDANQLLWYRHTGWQDGSRSWGASGEAQQIGNGWNFKHLFSGGNGVIYAVTFDGDLLWYRHTGWQDGSRSWAMSGEAQKIGNGWGNFKHLFSGGNGVIYAVNSDNQLLWYRHTGWQDGSASWAARDPQQIGNGWNFRQLFSGGDGVIYAVNSDNQLLWYKHTGWQNGSRSWAMGGEAQQIGNGWNFRQLFSGGNGVIYAVNSDNQLLWYKHTGWQDGSRSWAASGEAQQIGNGWNFRQLF